MEVQTIMSPGIGFGIIKKYVRGQDLKYEDKKIIIVTDEDLVASDTMNFEWDKISGIITTSGTKNSHSAIVAKQHEVPAAVISDITDFIDDDFIAIDTNSSSKGKVYYKPSIDELKKILTQLKILNIKKENLSKYKLPETITKDGHKVTVAANIGCSDDIAEIKKNCAEGIGVVRTEFSYEMFDSLEGRLPTEDELYEEYSKISNSLTDKPIIVRTLDAGADKPVSSLIRAGVLKENEINSALGSRGIRPCLEHPEILKTQVKAIMRANYPNNNLHIMFPMITQVEEIEKGKEIVDDAIKELRNQNMNFVECPIGIMVETPAIAQITDRLSNYCDFISIGTNDLTQYTTASDRMNDCVEKIANPYNPGMVRILKNIISGAHNGKKRIMCGVCGEIAADPKYIPLLLAMGLDEFSMNSSSILPARRLITNLTLEECNNLLDEVLEMDKSSEIESYLEVFYKEHNLSIMTKERESRKENLTDVLKRENSALDLRNEYKELVDENLPDYIEEEL